MGRLILKAFLAVSSIALIGLLGFIYHTFEQTSLVVPLQVKVNDVAPPHPSTLQRNIKGITINATNVTNNIRTPNTIHGNVHTSTTLNESMRTPSIITKTMQTSTVGNSTAGNTSVGTSGRPRSGRGYVVGLHFWEQQTAGTGNMLQLQCWAARHNLNFVEPLVRGGYIIGTFNDTDAAKYLGMSDLYDFETWQTYAKQSGMAPVVKRDEFMHEIRQFEKDVIIVEVTCDNQICCAFAKVKRSGWWTFQQQNPHLKVVRHECLSRSRPSTGNLDSLIFGNISAKDSLVIIELWKGRMGYSCGSGYRTQKVPSARVLKDVEKYADKYLGGLGKYNSIMARFEIAVPNYSSINNKKRQESVRVCANSTLKKWRQVQSRTSISNTFMTFDYGKYGSETYKAWNYAGSTPDLRRFHQIVYNNTWSVEEWEQSFENITGVYDRGYISLLHLVITAHSNCVILAGSSSYQSYMTSMYSKYHKGPRCIEHI